MLYIVLPDGVVLPCDVLQIVRDRSLIALVSALQEKGSLVGGFLSGEYSAVACSTAAVVFSKVCAAFP